MNKGPSRWTREEAIATKRADTRPARPMFEIRGADAAAARIGAETICAEPPAAPDLTDDALIAIFASTPVRRAEFPLVRDAFRRTYRSAMGAPMNASTANDEQALAPEAHDYAVGLGQNVKRER